jgi:hypothetical protein
MRILRVVCITAQIRQITCHVVAPGKSLYRRSSTPPTGGANTVKLQINYVIYRILGGAQ